MAGGLLVSTGMVIASFARSVVDMYVTIGIVSGESPWPGLSPTCQTLRSLPRATRLWSPHTGCA